jgi:hypothetical protein
MALYRANGITKHRSPAVAAEGTELPKKLPKATWHGPGVRFRLFVFPGMTYIDFVDNRQFALSIAGWLTSPKLQLLFDPLR